MIANYYRTFIMLPEMDNVMFTIFNGSLFRYILNSCCLDSNRTTLVSGVTIYVLFVII